MERKIGEIFEYNGEWYQCIEGSYCKSCDFYQPNVPALQCGQNLCCFGNTRKDKTSVIFKKLKKVGEPFERNGYMYQEYKAHTYPLLMNGGAKIPTDNGFAVIIKQTKEDMKTVKISKDDLNFLINKIRYGILPKYVDNDKIINEVSKLFSVDDTKLSNTEKIGKNLKPFDLEAAKSGKPVCTRDGRKARIICFDRVTNSTNEYTGHLIVLVTNPNGDEQSFYYTEKGNLAGEDEYDNHKWDLMMLPEKKKGWINIYPQSNIIHIAETSKGVYPTEAVAKLYTQADCIATIPIEWEE